MTVPAIDLARAPGPGRGAQTRRGEERRDMILKVAAQMFATHGYGGVSINDIGLTCGITGPAIYRYFPGKEDILISIYQQLYNLDREGIAAINASGEPPRARLEAMVDLQIELATGHPEKILIVDAEERNLPPETQEAFRDERRRLLKAWTDLIGKVRPDLTRDERDATVHAVLALINSIALRRKPDRVGDALRAHLKSMAMACLGLANAAKPAR